MAELAVSPDNQSTAVTAGLNRNRRLLALGVVLSVSISNFIATSWHSLFAPASSPDPSHRQFRLLIVLITETTSLLLLWFILSGQGRSWQNIGWKPKWRDVPHGTGLIIASKVAIVVTNMCFQLMYSSYTGHYLQARSIHSVFESGISVFSVLLVLVNPFFEELIVRAYAMSEVLDLGGSRTVAILLSVLIQMSYHSYQGLLRGILAATSFAVFSIYFSQTRRIGPVIFAHFYFDASALVRASF